MLKGKAMRRSTFWHFDKHVSIQKLEAWCKKQPVSVPWWRGGDCLVEETAWVTGVRKEWGVRPESGFFTGETSKKPNGVDMKIRLGELTNTRLTQKHKNGWVTLSIKRPCECFIRYQRILKDWDWSTIYKISDE